MSDTIIEAIIIGGATIVCALITLLSIKRKYQPKDNSKTKIENSAIANGNANTATQSVNINLNTKENKKTDSPKVFEVNTDELEDSVTALPCRENSLRASARFWNEHFTQIAGVSGFGLIDDICRHAENHENHKSKMRQLKGKIVKIGVNCNECYCNMIDKAEKQPVTRNLYKDNLANIARLSKCKKEHGFENIEIRLMLFGNSCTLKLQGDLEKHEGVIYLTPYTNFPGGKSPTSVVSQTKNKEVFAQYKDYLDGLWGSETYDYKRNLHVVLVEDYDKIVGKYCDSIFVPERLSTWLNTHEETHTITDDDKKFIIVLNDIISRQVKLLKITPHLQEFQETATTAK